MLQRCKYRFSKVDYDFLKPVFPNFLIVDETNYSRKQEKNARMHEIQARSQGGTPLQIAKCSKFIGFLHPTPLDVMLRVVSSRPGSNKSFC